MRGVYVAIACNCTFISTSSAISYSHGNMFLPNSYSYILERNSCILNLFALVAGTILLSSCCCSVSTAAAVSGGRPIQFVLSNGEQATRALQSQSQSATEGICSICGNVGGPSKLKPDAIWDGTFSGFGLIPESPYNNTTCASIEAKANTFDPPSVNNANEPIATSCLGIQSLAYIQCCNMAEWPTPVYECEQKVQEAWGDINSAIVPLPRGGGKLEVDASLLYYHLSELSTVQGTARVAIGVNLRWRDERLAWSPEEMGGCVSTSTYASLDAEKTKIWVPDFDLINQIGFGLHSFSDRYAEVYANGEINWFRYGGSFEAICGFTGLERFPYDTLECTMDFGSASDIPKIKYVQELSGPGLLITDVIGRSVINRIAPHYQEFTFIEEMSAFERLNDEMLRLKLYFRRSPRYYRMTVIIPTVLMTFLSFGQFVLDQRLGERLGFGVSLLLVMVAQSILTAELIPRCEELLWVNTFTSVSLYFMFFAAFESVFVAAFYYMDGNRSSRRASLRNRASINNGAYESEFGDDEDIDDADEGQVEKLKGEEPVIGRSKSSIPSISKQATTAEKALRSIEKILLAEPNLKETNKIRTIKLLDRACFFLLPVAYCIFFSAMLGTNHKW